MFNKTAFSFNHIYNLMDFDLAFSQVNAAMLGCWYESKTSFHRDP